MKKNITIFIADDHPIFRRGLKEVINEEKKFTIVGEASNGEEALKLILDKSPDITIIDIEMPKMNGLEIANRLKTNCAKTKIILLTMHKEEEFLYKAMDFGVAGYVLKDSALNEIINAINYVIDENYYVTPSMTKYLIERKRNIVKLSKEINGIELLTPVEKNILSLVAENKSSKEIAELLLISHRTVEKHRNNICKKLNLKGSYALLKFAIEHRKLL